MFINGATTIFSEQPGLSVSGTGIVNQEMGYGVVSYQEGGSVTYPVMLLSNNDPIHGKCEIFLSGTGADCCVGASKAFLELYLNYNEKTLKNLAIDIISVKRDVDFRGVTFRSIHGRDILNMQKRKRFYFSIDKSKDLFDVKEIPIDTRGIWFLFDITGIVSDLKNGILISIPEVSSDDYITTDENNIISGAGTLEFASPQWESWSGVEKTAENDSKWISIKNYGYKNKKYSPRIRFIK